MIELDRDIVDEPKSLVKDGTGEHLRAHKYYLSKEYADQTRKKAFGGHDAYSKPDVRKALDSIFNGNCAYCESKGSHLMTLHVEHFRPKGGVLGVPRKTHQGYYWLAAKWDNLMLSCENCNTRKKYQLSSGKEVTLGKGTYFGLDGNVKRAKFNSDCIEEEDYRLLINPCKDKVESLIEYESDGTLKGKTWLLGIDKKRVVASTIYYALSRIDLQKERARKYRRTESALRNVESRFTDFLRFGKDEPHRALELEDALAEIVVLLDPKESSYIGLSRQLYDPVRDRILEIKKKLKEKII